MSEEELDPQKLERAHAAFAAVPAFAQSAAQWPDRPVRLLVTVGAGGAADTLSRNLSNGFAQFANGQPLIVENRPETCYAATCAKPGELCSPTWPDRAT